MVRQGLTLGLMGYLIPVTNLEVVL